MFLNSREDQKKENLVNHLVHFYQNLMPKKLDIRPSDPHLTQKYLSQIQQIKNLRGRDLFYPYLGTGYGNGVYVQLMDGSVKMDLIGGIGVHILGHGHLELVKVVITAGLSDIVMQGHLLMNSEYLKLSQKLVKLASRYSRLQHVWLSTSGAMANENALKMIRQKHYFQFSKHRRKILAFDQAFAGRTIMMSEISGNPSVREGLPPYNEVLRIPFYDPKNPERSLSVLKSHIEREGHSISAFIFETILGEGGYKSAEPEFFISLFKECRKHNITIWADEVQTFCRTGEFFAFEKWKLGSYIDICTIGKTLQLAATFCTPEYLPKPGLVSGTFSASTSALSVGKTILDLMEKQYLKQIPKIEQEIKKLFEELLQKDLIKDYDCFGLMAAFTLKDSSKKNTINFLKKLFQNGVIAFFCNSEKLEESRVRFLLPVVITHQDIQTLKKVLQNSL